MQAFHFIKQYIKLLLSFCTIALLHLFESPHTSRLQFGGLGEPFLGLFEVDDGPDGIKIVSFDIEILEVERMLPDIDTNDGDMGQERILVGSGDNLQALGGGVQAQPSPSRPLNTKSGSVELLLEVVEAAKRLVNGVLQRTGLQNASISLVLRCSRGKVLPEQRVVDMSTAVELESSLEGDTLLGGGCLGICSLCGIESVDVSLMMLLVVKLHDLSANERLKGIIAVREVRESVLAGHVVIYDVMWWWLKGEA